MGVDLCQADQTQAFEVVAGPIHGRGADPIVAGTGDRVGHHDGGDHGVYGAAAFANPDTVEVRDPLVAAGSGRERFQQRVPDGLRNREHRTVPGSCRW